MFCCCAVSVVCGGHLAAVSEVVQRSKHGRGSARIMRNSRFEPETAGNGEMNGCHQQPQQSRRPLLSLVSPEVLARGAQSIAEVYVREKPFTVDPRASQCAFWICLQVAGVHLR